MSTTTTATAAAAAADFANPVYMEEEHGSTGSTASATDIPVIDLNDPNLLLADMDANQDLDPYAAPPPLPDGRWTVKIKQRDVKGPDGQPARYTVKTDKNGQLYAYTALDATVIDPTGKFDGINLTDYFVSTRPDTRRGGAIPLSWILKCLGVQLPAKINAKVLLDEFFKATASEPQIEVDTVWEGSLSQDDQERFDQSGERAPRVLGMHRFPQQADGSRLPEVEVDTKLGKVFLRARPRINGYFPKGSAQASGMQLGPRGR